MSDASSHQLVKGYNELGLGLYRDMAQEPGNVFFSPYSIATAFTMTYAGARGTTAEQMAQVLGLPANDAHGAAHELAAALRPGAGSGYQLNVANRLWAQQGLPIADEFRELTTRYYGAGIETVDFAKATEASRRAINQWVATETADRIKNLLAPNAVSALTRLVLTNAIYFKGTWQHQFDVANTEDATFFGDSETTVPLMSQRGRFRYSESAQWQALRLPYVGGKLSMLVFLPRVKRTLSDLETSLSWDQLGALRNSMVEAEVSVWLPRFSTSSQFILNKAMSDLGMAAAFNPVLADFSGITGHRGLFISKAIHKAFIDVNEEGSEAAAATAVVMGVESVPRTIDFRADHPFIFMIVDDDSGAVLFFGRLVEPAD